MKAKFRAWAGEEMIDESYNDDHYILTIENGEVIVIEQSLDEYGGYSPSVAEIMQFTGLKDKNGKEIYEGDLLRFPAKDNYEKKNFSAFEIFFHDNDCADRHIGFQMCRMHNYGAIGGGFCGHPFLPKTTKKMEIIGNIYENPELIK